MLVGALLARRGEVVTLNMVEKQLLQGERRRKTNEVRWATQTERSAENDCVRYLRCTKLKSRKGAVEVTQ